jgi:hypothetical protein
MTSNRIKTTISDGNSGIEGVGVEFVDWLGAGVVEGGGLGAAFGFGSARKGMKLTVPKLKSFLKS